MLSPHLKGENLAGRLLLSSALVAVSLAYGWWQRGTGGARNMAMAPIAKAPAILPRSPARVAPHASSPTTTDARVAARAQPGSNEPAPPAAPQSHATRAALNVAKSGIAPDQAQGGVPKSTGIARTQQTGAAAAQATPEPQQNPPAPPSAPLTSQAALEMYLPTEDASPPLALVTGTPAAGATPAIPAGTHLEDGDYLSDKHLFEWGDLKVKISVRGGQITGVQIVQYPDHRSQSLYLSQMAGPILESEVIETQQAQVDAVSSATDTSYAFQDTIANVILKATRG